MEKRKLSPYFFKTSRSACGGFSLIEVLVSLSIFTVVVTISVGALMMLISANARAQNMQSAMTNISYALDSITREIRTGTDYFCGAYNTFPLTTPGTPNANRDCINGASALSFNEGGRSLTGSASSRRIAYRLSNGFIERRLGNGDGDANPNEVEDWFRVTSPDVQITELSFYTTGSARGVANTQSPTVTLYLKGTSGEDDGTQVEFNIQTTVVQQLLDI